MTATTTSGPLAGRTPSRVAAAAALAALGALGVLGLAPALAAQEERPPQPADALLATASAPGWSEVAGLEARGTLAAGGREMDFHLWRARDDRFRLELTHRGATQVFVVDGDGGWIQVGAEPATPLAASQAWERLSWADVFARFPDFYRRYPRREVEAPIELQGQAVRTVRLWPRSGYPYLYHVDPATGRIVAGVRQFYEPEADAVREARLYYGDFREVAPGVWLAFTVESDEGTYYQTLALDEVRLLRDPPPAELFARDP